MRQRIEMLQKVKKELESAQSAQNYSDEANMNDEANAEAAGEVEDSNETLETLLRKLASASIEEITAVDFNAAGNQSELEQSRQKDTNADKPEMVNFENEQADVKIRESISVLLKLFKIVFTFKMFSMNQAVSNNYNLANLVLANESRMENEANEGNGK